ncbi:NAD-dependent epimerase/dehydratase family protein [Chelatococcus reniformis]|uniref:UDP-N-acetylglucosamine 4-epimerase n=1 Tax=Chelatococcus reniformis TaxID=1494448 RepID=A0A916U271_9HYPH|nr:NAD-dependent epimerase/dehydratase family protein [Chelatococcus reniformis]GGC53988.1 UDP-N-acetylglucosamine 4-epimerase [Chelatococcus reniformis]
MGRVLVTGAAGFIGSHVVRGLLEGGEDVVGIDNLNAYYDPALKYDRLGAIRATAQGERFQFVKADLSKAEEIISLIAESDIDRIVHLGAQAGVRWSLEAPFAYTAANVTGHLAVLEGARAAAGRIRHLVYASTSSVYGSRTDGPFREGDRTDHPESLYAATKLADELMSSVYARLYDLPITGLRFFTVYGPWGRPDMAYWIFTEAMQKRAPIRLFNGGHMERDFTYVDDVVAGVLAVLASPPQAAAHRLYNIGNSRPVPLLEMIRILEGLVGVEAEKILEPMQPGDVPATFADVSAIERDFGWRPTTDLASGLARFFEWWQWYARQRAARQS